MGFQEQGFWVQFLQRSIWAVIIDMFLSVVRSKIPLEKHMTKQFSLSS